MERVRYALRYVGQSFELWIEAAADAAQGELRERFELAHEREFGYREPGAAVEVVTVTASVWGRAPELRPRARAGSSQRGTQRIVHGGRELDATLLRGAPRPGERLDGPAICALPEATLLITPGWGGRVLDDATIELRRS